MSSFQALLVGKVDQQQST